MMPRQPSDFGRLVSYGIPKNRLQWLSKFLADHRSRGIGNHRSYADEDVRFLILADVLTGALFVPHARVAHVIDQFGAAWEGRFGFTHDYSVVRVDSDDELMRVLRSVESLAVIDIGRYLRPAMRYWHEQS